LLIGSMALHFCERLGLFQLSFERSALGVRSSFLFAMQAVGPGLACVEIRLALRAEDAREIRPQTQPLRRRETLTRVDQPCLAAR
jgi:hypothetical protein